MTSYFESYGFQRDRERLFTLIAQHTAALERIAVALERQPPKAETLDWEAPERKEAP